MSPARFSAVSLALKGKPSVLNMRGLFRRRD
jgi:hypothetical protein